MDLIGREAKLVEVVDVDVLVRHSLVLEQLFDGTEETHLPDLLDLNQIHE